MKINAKKNTSLAIGITMMCLVLFTYGCTQSETGSTQTQTTVDKTSASTRPSPPSIDLHSAVLSDNIDAVKQHIMAGSNINEKDPFGGSSPLISAALFDKKAMVEILLEAGAELNFQNNDGSTALHTAAFFCRPEIVQLLLDNGADKTIQNNTNNTAYDIVAGSFEEVKPIYDMLGQTLAPFGLVLDYEQLKKTRPQIAAVLK